MVQLSILIPSTPDRKQMTDLLLGKLYIQREVFNSFHSTLGEVEIIVDDSKRFLDGGLSIGKKRESLVSKAKGKYCCFLDSDDNISPGYIESLMRLCHQYKDVCTFRALAKLKGYWTTIDMGLSYQFNEEATDRHEVRRRPWHICPVRTEFAQQEEFLDKNAAEDFEWFERVLKYCATEAKSNQLLYEYRHGDHSESDEILKQGYV